MTFRYMIHQVPHRCGYRFMPFSFAMEHGLSWEDYVSVYGGTIEADTIGQALERIFGLHNRDDRPNGQGMHSLSMADVVELNGKPYYCDRFGWSEVPKDRWY